MACLLVKPNIITVKRGVSGRLDVLVCLAAINVDNELRFVVKIRRHGFVMFHTCLFRRNIGVFRVNHFTHFDILCPEKARIDF